MLAFLLFAFVASITPGPTNILVLSNSARFGLRATVPIILGGCAAAALIVLAVGTGVGRTLMTLPYVQPTMTAVGLLWLTSLAWKIWAAPAEAVSADDQRRLGLGGAASLQLVNPKTWMMALAVVSVFSAHGLAVHWLSLGFFLVSLPCMTCWALLGAGSARWISSPRAMQRMNRVLAVLLLVSAWTAVLL
ncbi:LysE family transporter [Pseudomonas sp. M47T1]|uniref:LysE family translocator n=1 Tax=unclassified Pseudomonas TaxID=196821 RepID=UPI0002608810|nr:LysE family translocator [Pseudomonas sp. M47T1]EIK96565.1 LysE family transporter [Pseudomonas sp. M47T1]